MDFLVCGLRNFSISNYSEPIEIKVSEDDTVFYLLFQEPELLNIAYTHNYAQRFGSDEVSKLLSNVVCYASYKQSIGDASKRTLSVNNFYACAQIFSNALWLIKDNSVTPSIATLSSNSAIEPEILRRNVYYSNAESNYENLSSFTLEEINEATKLYYLLESLTEKKNSSQVETLKNSLVNMSKYIQFNIPSFQRANFFLDTTRKSDFLPAKIAGYISILETFYAIKGDNAHKTSERTAALIGSNSKERILLFKQVKEAYDIRSMYIHGSHIKDSKNKKLPEVSKNMDIIVRKVFLEMLLNHEDLNYTTNNSSIDNIFNEMVLSIND